MDPPEREKLMQELEGHQAQVKVLKMANEHQPVSKLPKELRPTLDDCIDKGLVLVKPGVPKLGPNLRGFAQALVLTDPGVAALRDIVSKCKDIEHKLKKGNA